MKTIIFTTILTAAAAFAQTAPVPAKDGNAPKPAVVAKAPAAKTEAKTEVKGDAKPAASTVAKHKKAVKAAKPAESATPVSAASTPVAAPAKK